MERIRHFGEEASLRRRADDKPWWCYWYPAACEWPSGGHYTRQTTTRRQTSTSTTRTTSKTSTSRTTAPQTTKAAPPPVTQPAATQPAATPPAATPTAQTSAQPAPAPAPSPTAQPTTSAPMAPPPATNTGKPDAQSTAVDPVVVQPNESSPDNPGNGNGANPTPTQVGDSAGSDHTTGVNLSPTGASGNGDDFGHQSGLPSVVAPSPSTSGAGETTGIPGPTAGSAGPGGGSSGGGLPPGAIPGIVVGLLFLLALLAFLLYRFRRTPVVQRMLAPFGSRGGGAGGFHRVDTPGGDGMGRTLLTPAPGATATAAPTQYGRSLTSHPPMGQTGHLHPLAVPAAAATRDSNRVSVFTNDSAASTGAFTPSPVSPVSPNGMLSPGTVRSSRPTQEPPDPRIVTAANAHVSRGSVSSIGTGSAISAALSPGQMAWPMPPGTPPVIRHPEGPRYVDFEQSGETVVRISHPPRNRRSGGY
ncbi:uncharacterized protein B0T15DRAFT_493313 [Chaetomium strumarium]|uniref:Uncharacterized protein n=1 Tax=Chaetomium strumarium TaxID=1170767 RepID=A0AAJ0M143_9PEZI|nr:hypothetical protein B0T15DRAFT_493313 [Chaetomium strumarium]